MSGAGALGKLEPEPTPAQRIALAAVRNGAVRLDDRGNRTYPDAVSGTALTACFNREWCAWDMKPEKRIAFVTTRGMEALR